MPSARDGGPEGIAGDADVENSWCDRGSTAVSTSASRVVDARSAGSSESESLTTRLAQRGARMSAAKGATTALEAIESAADHWRSLDGARLVALVCLSDVPNGGVGRKQGGGGPRPDHALACAPRSRGCAPTANRRARDDRQGTHGRAGRRGPRRPLHPVPPSPAPCRWRSPRTWTPGRGALASNTNSSPDREGSSAEAGRSARGAA